RRRPFTLFLTKSTFLLDYRYVSSGYVAVGTQLLSRPDALDTLPGIPVSPPAEAGYAWDEKALGQDGTLLAAPPAPGTGPPPAIVGYPTPPAGRPEATPFSEKPSSERPAD